MFYRTPHNYDWVEASDDAARAVGPYGESMTVQSMAEDADINVLMKRFGVTGQMPQSVRIPEYGDFTGVRDFASAMLTVESSSNGRAVVSMPSEPELNSSSVASI